MKVIYENNKIQFDANYRGWNPQVLAEQVSPELWEVFCNHAVEDGIACPEDEDGCDLPEGEFQWCGRLVDLVQCYTSAYVEHEL